LFCLEQYMWTVRNEKSKSIQDWLRWKLIRLYIKCGMTFVSVNKRNIWIIISFRISHVILMFLAQVYIHLLIYLITSMTFVVSLTQKTALYCTVWSRLWSRVFSLTQKWFFLFGYIILTYICQSLFMRLVACSLHDS
jgi:hypothetical protein